MNYARKVLKYYFIFLIIGVIALTLSFLGSKVSLCLFYNKFYIPCPACGITRAFKAFLTGDIIGALNSHPLFWTVPLIPFIAAMKKERYIYIFGFVFIAVWIIRLINTYPTFY